MMIERIEREHGYMKRLLTILNDKVHLLQTEDKINYALVKDVVDYLARHCERIRHPKDDVMYGYYLAHYGGDEQLDNLAEELGQLSKTTDEFLAMIDMVLQDAVVPQDVFVHQLQSFIALQQQHLAMEERYILPQLKATLTAKDWQYLESQWPGENSDPLFGDVIEHRYRQVAQRRQHEALET